MDKTRFEWDARKDAMNQEKYGVPFSAAQYAFADPNHSLPRTLPIAKLRSVTFASVQLTEAFLPFALPYRCGVIRIIGAGYWRKGKVIYEHEN